MAEDKKEEKAPTEAEAPAGKKKVMIFSGAGLAIVIGAAFLFTTFAVPAPPDPLPGEPGVEGEEVVESEEEVLSEGLEIFDVPMVMVNLKGTNKKRVLKIHLNAMYQITDPLLGVELFDQKTPEIKDTLTTLLTEKSLEDLESQEDLNLLRIELLDALNRVVFTETKGEIKKLYYQELIIQ